MEISFKKNTNTNKKSFLLYCFTILLAFLLLKQSSCFLAAESAKIEQPKKVPIFSPSQATKVPKKAQAKALAFGGAQAKKDQEGDGLTVFDVNKCDEYNDELCRDKLDELDLYYCHCYEDSEGEIVRCGYRGRRDKCKTPVFD
jgi:hypothetical protein